METLKIDAATLAADAAWLAKGAPHRVPVPVLGTAHVSVTDAGLRLRMSDYDLWREVTVPAENAAAAAGVAILVDPVKLAAFLKGAKGDALVTVNDSGVEIVTSGRTVKISKSGSDIADFPEWPGFESVESASMDVATLKRGLTSAGNDDTLPMLTGVRFDAGVMATTDRFRLSVITYAPDGFTALVPSGPLKLFTVGKGDVTVAYGRAFGTNGNPNHIRVTRDQRSVVSQVMDASFPKFRQLMPSPDDYTVQAEVRKADLLAAVAGDNVDLELHSDGTITVTGRELRDESVSVSQTIAANVSGDGTPFLVRVNSGYLSSLLKGIAADVFELGLTTPARPLTLRAGDDHHLLMPVRLPG